jgi:hypothetical protein
MKSKRIIRCIESVFNILYLCTVLTMGIYIILTAKSGENILFGIMAIVLVSGDLCHLVPRIALTFSGNEARFSRSLGTGKMIASVSMTLCYIFLWHIGILSFAPPGAIRFTVPVYSLAAIRIILTLLPQNKWGENDSPAAWNLYRNIPFVLLGFAVGVLFFVFRDSGMLHLRGMWLAILLSFAFYIPVILWSKKYPPLGMLMIAKSCVYIWIIAMGL